MPEETIYLVDKGIYLDDQFFIADDCYRRRCPRQ